MAIRGGRGLGQALMIKYGLPAAPTDTTIRTLQIRANQLIAAGNVSELAGRKAAAETFVGFETRVYASEADDIASLLDAARNR